METKLAKIGLAIMIVAITLRYMLIIEPKQQVYSLFENLSNKVSSSSTEVAATKHRRNQRTVHFNSNYNQKAVVLPSLTSKSIDLADTEYVFSKSGGISSAYKEPNEFTMFSNLNQRIHVKHRGSFEIEEPLGGYNTINANMSMFFPGK